MDISEGFVESSEGTINEPPMGVCSSQFAEDDGFLFGTASPSVPFANLLSYCTNLSIKVDARVVADVDELLAKVISGVTIILPHSQR